MAGKFERIKGRVRLLTVQVTDPSGRKIVNAVRKDRLTFLPASALFDLRRRMQQMEDEGIPGSVLEAGCALGGSAIVLAATKRPDRSMMVYDVFGMIPPPSESDGPDVHGRYAKIVSGQAEGFGNDPYYGYEQNLQQKVTDSFQAHGVNLARLNVELVKGLFQDTLHPDGPVALAHVDGDWYESVSVCLERIWPQLSLGGVIVIDDYDSWSGCHRAVDEFVTSTADVRTERRTRIHLIKT